MKQFTINGNEAGQRFDKYLAKLLREAPKSFVYKMLRKKNITLNGKKATGNEKLNQGDEIRLFLSDETYLKFSGKEAAPRASTDLAVIYENRDILLINKPAGMLSQPDETKEPSLVEYVTGYLLDTGAVTEEELITSGHLCAIVWTKIPADLWRQEKVWQGFRLSQSFFMTGPSIRIIFVS